MKNENLSNEVETSALNKGVSGSNSFGKITQNDLDKDCCSQCKYGEFNGYHDACFTCAYGDIGSNCYYR